MIPESEVPTLVGIGRADWRTEKYDHTSAVCLDGEFHITQGPAGEADADWIILDREGAVWLHEALGRALASRLTRQKDETRRAALEEAAKVADAWALKSPSQLRLHGGEMTAQDVRTAKAFMTAVCGAIRALKEAGHG